jgi:hypothetical protein
MVLKGNETMIVRRLTMLTGTAALAVALTGGAALAHTRHHYVHHARYVGEYAYDTGAVLDPYGGPIRISSRPVPDTPFNRARFGGPMSYGGQRTAPIGD